MFTPAQLKQLRALDRRRDVLLALRGPLLVEIGPRAPNRQDRKREQRAARRVNARAIRALELEMLRILFAALDAKGQT